MQYGICVPNLAEFSDPRQVAALARRAEQAGWDGIAPMIVSPRDGSLAATPEVVAEIVAAVGEHCDGGDPFDVVITGRTEPADAKETVTALAAAARLSGPHHRKERPWNHRARAKDQARKRRVWPRSCGTSSRSSS